MKRNSLQIIAFLIIAVLTFIGCKKDSSNGAGSFSNSRVISMKYYYDNTLTGNLDINYTNSKVSSYTYEDEDESEEGQLEYPDGNTIILNWSETYEDILYEFVTEYSLSNNKVVEILDGDEKELFTYNSAGKIEEIRGYFYDGVWTLQALDQYTYSSGNLATWYYAEYEGAGVYEYKQEITYNSNEIDEIVYYYKESDTWIADIKDVFVYSNGKVSRVNYYYYDGEWIKDEGYKIYKYNSSGFLIEMSEIYGVEKYTEKYSYEEGNGNFNLIFDSHNYSLTEPMPVKKSPKVNKLVKQKRYLKTSHFRKNRDIGVLR
jgi:hypothetical protein